MASAAGASAVTLHDRVAQRLSSGLAGTCMTVRVPVSFDPNCTPILSSPVFSSCRASRRSLKLEICVLAKRWAAAICALTRPTTSGSLDGSGLERTAVTSLAVLLAVLVSPPPDTVATLVSEPPASGATLTTTAICGHAAPGPSASWRVQLAPATVQVHPVPEMAVSVMPAGKVSVTVTAPAVGATPTLLTVMAYGKFCWPCFGLPVWVLAMARSTVELEVTMVGSLAVLLVALESPPPLTVAVLVTLPGALAATFTMSATGGYEAPGPSASARVQVVVAPSVQVQPAPLAALGLMPAGMVSLTVMRPAVGPEPELRTVMV